ncbi:MAG: triose-phosphate isomerase, partial [Bacteroidia bacterium]|nr:triose-phosphate isomerase [Bacteroidia bacterium]
RKSGKQEQVVESQIKNALFHLEASAFDNIVLAYEPVWAIGTGETASPEQAQDMHAFIRKTIANKYGAEVANEVSILYGGSCKPGNAQEIFSKPDVDGGLIGGAALNAEDFLAIVNAF